MAGQGNGRRLARERRAENFGRTTLSASLVQAIGALRPSRVARWLGMSDRALRRWRGGNVKITGVEDIINEPELALTFARCLQTHVLKRMRLERRKR